MIENVLLLILISLVLTAALREILIHDIPVFKNIVWKVMFPSYTILIIIGIMNVFVFKIPETIRLVQALGWLSFIYSALVCGVILFFAQRVSRIKIAKEGVVSEQ